MSLRIPFGVSGEVAIQLTVRTFQDVPPPSPARSLQMPRAGALCDHRRAHVSARGWFGRGVRTHRVPERGLALGAEDTVMNVSVTRAERDVVLLFDVDNTLLDNDTVLRDYRAHLVQEVGREAADHYWVIFEELRRELGYVDYLGALQRYRLEHLHDPRLFLLSSYLLDYPFERRLYPGALDVLARFGRLGLTVILSDGDVVFQPRKIERSGIRRAVEDRVLIRIHKERELECVERFYPAAHYVLIDDKLPILAAVKRIWGPRVTTVFPRQGHYALDPDVLSGSTPADLVITGIGDLMHYDPAALLEARARDVPPTNDSRQAPRTGGLITRVDP